MSNTSSPSRSQLAFRDAADGVRKVPVWAALGWQDIRQRYRRSVLGPLWITLTTLITIIAMGPLYGALLKFSVSDFVPYLALGLIVWGLLASTILEGCLCFVNAESMIRSIRLPLSLHVFRTIYRNFLVFAHNSIAFIPIMLAFHVVPTWSWLMIFPGLLIFLFASYPLTIILSIFCTRFRDMQQIVGSVVQLAFFVTPILWKPELLHNRAYLANANPLYLFVQIIRGPIYGDIPALSTYATTIAITAVLYVIAIPLFVRFRSRIPYWI